MKIEYKITFEKDSITVTQSVQREPSDGGGTGFGPDPDIGGNPLAPDPDIGGGGARGRAVAVVFGPVIITNAGTVAAKSEKEVEQPVHDQSSVNKLRNAKG